MKRIAIISLLAVFLTSNYAYAIIPIEELAQKIEKAKYQELTREEVEQLYVDLITSIDSEDFENQSIKIQGLESCLRSIVYYLLINAIVGQIFGQYTYIIRILLFLDVIDSCLF